MGSKKEKKTGWQIRLDKELVNAAGVIYSEVCDLIDNTNEVELNDEARTTKRISDIIINNTAYMVNEYYLKQEDIEKIYGFFDAITTHTKPDEDGNINLLEGSIISGICIQNGLSEKNINQPDVFFKDSAELSKYRITNLYLTKKHHNSKNFWFFLIPAVLSIIAIVVSIIGIVSGASPK